ncbi:unnamed protein product [Acanthoscelides obtectus]|uniref:Myb/SANT-like DNA-binding domain-containing protein n=1 Tax=Acanthoscelides obtectus TaxID=200917 RepID=A0A9P0M122_ACAOB|nr:unnamed protein product [Acanthoscelides obtectus]CAK1625129.1 hypothetical protein AOBTE_LOCUS2978 [Acanthoscelides obtectus]
MEIAKEQEETEILPETAQTYVQPKSIKFEPLWVQVLINLRMKHSKMFTRRRNSASEGWKLVFEELKENGAPEYVTITKIKKKWMNLMTRYRQIKNTTLNTEAVTWPYFEQIDRAFGKDCENEDEKGESLLNQSISNDERQSFIKKLIELRYNHRHLFTGRKYTARDGWLIIQSLLQCQGKYSIEQLSKCWQNLVQRYKQLSKSENTENITWPYYEHMTKMYVEKCKYENISVTTEANSSQAEDISTVEGEDKEVLGDVKHQIINLKNVSVSSVSVDCILVQLLTEIRAAEENNHKEVMQALKAIHDSLNINSSVKVNNVNNEIVTNVGAEIIDECMDQ